VYGTQALAQAEKRLKPYSSRVKLYHSCFTRLDQVLEDARVGDGVDGVFADLGLLRSHSELANRGFSYKLKGRLDMRYDPKVCFSPAVWCHRPFA
jgi:16S rRNA C1402 N4-methylase RsmH